MTPDRLRQVEELYHAARKDRAALAKADPELRQEVESLLCQGGPLPELGIDSTVTQVGPGTQLGPYEIEGALGAGGMGQVYKARDTRLGRAVAIKIVSEHFSERFEREARAISALNHSNICTLYDVGPNYLVMELVEGETLAARLKRGKLSIEDTLRFGAQIADALAAAHAKGIIHRDLKPGNIMVTKSGVKVLDFGLAKSQQDETVTVRGAVMGTPAYMAPEQLEGKACDARTDIYAVGLVLQEMVNGKKDEAIGSVPEKFAHVVEQCLEKDPENRWQSASDVRAELEWARKNPAQIATVKAPSNRLASGIAAVAILTASILGWIHFREMPALPAEPVRFQIPLPEKMSFGSSGTFAVSPDGRRLVLEAAGSDGVSRLWLRALDSVDMRPLPNTESAVSPIWSPDSRSIAFAAGRKLAKIDLLGGPAQDICDLAAGIAGGSWNRDGVIIFGSGEGVMRVAATGGNVTPVTSPAATPGMVAHRYPSMLPDGKHFLYLGVSTVQVNGNNRVYVGSLDAKPEAQNSKPLLATDYRPIYVPSSDSGVGQLLYLRGDTMVAQTFDTGQLKLTGEPVPVAGQVGANQNNFLGFFAASGNGVLVYRSGVSRDLQLTLFDRQGKVLGTAGEPGRYASVGLSPDGTRAAVNRADPQTGNQDIWLIDLSQGAATRFTFDPANENFPLWSPDGSRIAFLSYRGGVNGIYVKAVRGAANEELIFKSSQNLAMAQWSPDGRFVTLGMVDAQTGLDVWILPDPLSKSGERKLIPFLRTQFNEAAAAVSPDSRWIAYRSNESGRAEVYVQPFNPSPDAGTAAAGGKWMVSKGGSPGMVRWRGDGKELYYLSPDGKVMAVEISTNPVFRAGSPAPLFQVPPTFLRAAPAPGTLVDVTADGKRFLFAIPVQQSTREELTVVLNWPAALKH
jgi:Tol biopolymer transport system component/predicted Ser/Thr protein kinase